MKPKASCRPCCWKRNGSGPCRKNSSSHAPTPIFRVGLYADQLKRYYDLFPAEQICCLNFNDILMAPGQLLRTVHDFLGITARPEDADGLGAINRATGEDESMTAKEREWLDAAYRKPNEELEALLGTALQWSEAL